MATNSTTPEGVPTPKQTRLAAELSQNVVAARVGVSPLTIRLYEANRDAVSVRMRRRLDALYAEIASQTQKAA